MHRLVALALAIAAASPAFAQKTLPGFEYRDGWKAGPWEGNASYDRGKFLGCNAGFSPAAKMQFRLRGLPQGRAPILVLETDKIDADLFFAAKPRKTRGIVSVGGLQRDLPVTEVAKVWFELVPEEDILAGVSRGGDFVLTLEGGRSWTVALPAESEAAVEKWRKCVREQRD